MLSVCLDAVFSLLGIFANQWASHNPLVKKTTKAKPGYYDLNGTHNYFPMTGNTGIEYSSMWITSDIT